MVRSLLGLLFCTGLAWADAPREIAPLPRPVVPRFTPKGGRPGEVVTPAAKGERLPDKLTVGDTAPDFTLRSVDGKAKVTLSEFRDKKPVVLIFASYT